MNVMIIDTETANDVSQPLPYDIGYAILDTETDEILVERSFVVAEIFFDKELMENSYFAEKIPAYWSDIRNGKRIIKGLWNIRKTLHADMKEYHVSKVGAYNMGFDKRATNNDARFITGSFLRWFFPYRTKFFCIWNMACSSILNTSHYINYAIENGFVSDKGNISTSAENAYRYIINDPTFEESHTGLEDVRIEIEIMKAVFDSEMEYDDKIYSACWRIPNKLRKQMELEEIFAEA